MLSEHRGVWVFSEDHRLMLELLGKGSEIASKLQTELTAVLIGKDIENRANELIRYGADKVHLVDSPLLEKFQAERYLGVLSDLALQYEPDIILIGSTRNGKEMASRLATRLKTGCVTDCIQLKVSDDKRLLMKRIVYGGNAVATVLCRTDPQISTVPPRVFEKIEAKERDGQIVPLNAKIEEPKTEIVETKELEASDVNVEEAKVVIAGGRGLEKKEDVKLLNELAKVLGGQVGYTRPLAEDRKWFIHWIGLSGHTVRPELYIACGISGVIQHVAGIRDSRIIVAINKDEEAPIFEFADYVVVGDLYEIVPALSAALEKTLKSS